MSISGIVRGFVLKLAVCLTFCLGLLVPFKLEANSPGVLPAKNLSNTQQPVPGLAKDQKLPWLMLGGSLLFLLLLAMRLSKSDRALEQTTKDRELAESEQQKLENKFKQ